jgi:hypothetical protein
MNTSVKQRAIMEIAGMTEMDITHAMDWYQSYHGKMPTWEEAYDTLSAMRACFSRVFYEELAKLKVKEAV